MPPASQRGAGEQHGGAVRRAPRRRRQRRLRRLRGAAVVPLAETPGNAVTQELSERRHLEVLGAAERGKEHPRTRRVAVDPRHRFRRQLAGLAEHQRRRGIVQRHRVVGAAVAHLGDPRQIADDGVRGGGRVHHGKLALLIGSVAHVVAAEVVRAPAAGIAERMAGSAQPDRGAPGGKPVVQRAQLVGSGVAEPHTDHQQIGAVEAAEVERIGLVADAQHGLAAELAGYLLRERWDGAFGVVLPLAYQKEDRLAHVFSLACCSLSATSATTAGRPSRRLAPWNTPVTIRRRSGRRKMA